MEHYQEQYKCSVCGREFVVDLTSIGIGHQTIQAITCLECSKKVGGNLMGNEREELEFKDVSGETLKI